jgi:hypothetical protein
VGGVDIPGGLEKRSVGGVCACALPVVPAAAAATVTAAATISRREASGSSAADMLELDEDVMILAPSL